MIADRWPAADERLVRHYRRLLLAYSGRYRRLHGTEMITTMLEMAEPSRSRPSAGEAWHLIGSGVRQRFRLPSGRPFTAVAAVLATIVLGVFGAAAGSQLGESTSASLPSRPEAVRLLNAAATDPAMFFIHRFPMSGGADSLTVDAELAAGRPNWTVDDARAGLTVAGWTITEFAVPSSQESTIYTTDATTGESHVVPSTTATLTADRDGLTLIGTATAFPADKSSDGLIGGVQGQIFAERSATYLPLTIAGGLLGALAGWLLTAALAYRIRSLLSGPSRLAVAFTGIAFAIAGPPVWAVIDNAVMLGQHFTSSWPVYTLHAALLPASHLREVTAWFIPGCTIAAAAAAAIAVGILALGAGRGQPPLATQPTGSMP